jgi:hypothetical protein
MKIVADTVGGWMWWVGQWKLKHPDQTPNYKEMMQQYIKGENP